MPNSIHLMRLTYILLIFMFLVFIAEVLIPGLADAMALSRESLLAQPWTLVTTLFAHAGLMHLLSNAIVMFFFGVAVEEELGKGRMLAIFLLSAFAGSALSLIIYPADSSFIGASAGIFGLVGAGMLVKPMGFGMYGFFPMPLALLGMMYAVYNAFGVFYGDPTISYAGHFGGLAVGLIWGLSVTGLRRGLGILIIVMAILMALPLLIAMATSALGITI